MLNRYDFIFSYWIFAWYVLYELQLVSYNPKGVLLLALIENVIILGMLFYYSNPYILSFCIVNFFIKVIPLWRVWNTPYRRRDVYATLVLFCVYVVWVWIHDNHILNTVQQKLNNVKQKKPIGPMITLLQKYMR